MERFSNAEVGDLVYCRKRGYGVITGTEAEHENYPIECSFGAKSMFDIVYTLAGRDHIRDIEPILFYRNATSNYLTERPED